MVKVLYGDRGQKMTPNLKRTHSPGLTLNTLTTRQKEHHPTDTTNRPREDISPSLSEPEDALSRTTSHHSSPPRLVINSRSNGDGGTGQVSFTPTRSYILFSLSAPLHCSHLQAQMTRKSILHWIMYHFLGQTILLHRRKVVGCSAPV